MKATLTFTLPEEQEEFKLACKAGELHSALWDLRDIVRNKLKYEQLSQVEYDIWKNIQDEIINVTQSLLE